jgi:hypothetical protein
MKKGSEIHRCDCCDFKVVYNEEDLDIIFSQGDFYVAENGKVLCNDCLNKGRGKNA